MDLEQTMEKYGFRLSAGCSGKAAYTKSIKYKGKRAYSSVTAVGGGFPTSLDDPVEVVIYELRSGDEMDDPRQFGSLRTYLEMGDPEIG